MPFGERVERGEPRRRLDLAPVGGAVLAENADELVDLHQCLAGHFLDRFERGSRSRRILLLQEACGPGLNEDHVDRMSRGVVEVAGDAGTLLGGCQAPLALGLPLGQPDALDQVGQSRAALTDTVAEYPGTAPDDRSEEERHHR